MTEVAKRLGTDPFARVGEAKAEVAPMVAPALQEELELAARREPEVAFTVRLPADVARALRKEACDRTMRTDRPVSMAAVAREVILRTYGTKRRR